MLENNSFFKIFNNKKIYLLFFFLIFLFFLKSPYIFLYGRFKIGAAEMYANSLNSNWSEVLVLVNWAAGYLNLFSNILSFINAKFIFIEYAALFNIYFNFVINLLIIYFIIFKDSYLFQSFREKVLGSIIVVISPIFIFEIWLDALNAQVYLGILTLIILFLKNNNKNKYFQTFIIFINGLSGVYSCILTPAFLLKAFKTRKKIDFFNFFTIFITSIIQFMLILYSKFSNKLYVGKLNVDYFFNYDEFISYSYNIIIRPFFSTSFSNFLIDDLFNLRDNKQLLILLATVAFIFLLVFLINFLKLIFISNSNNKFCLIVLLYFFLASSLLVTIGGVNDWVGGRYSVIPSFCITMMIFKMFFLSEKQLIKNISFFLIFISLSNGIYDYQNPKYTEYYKCINCPHWKDEVAKFKENNDYELKVWPYTEDRKINLNSKYF